MAGRIPDQFIDELLARTDLADVVSSRISLKKTGQNYSALCPFHNEKSPSFSLNPNKQFYYCFGCGAGGNAISFVMEHDHVDFVDAIETLAKDACMEVPREQGAPDRYEQNAELLKRLSESSQFYQKQLTQHPDKKKATDYLSKDRGLSGQIAKVFGLGYAPSGWDNLLKKVGTRAESQEQLLLGGMLIEKKDQPGHYYDRFRDRIIFPIRDSRGRVIAFGGRAFGDEKPKYLNSPETPVFQKSQELYGLFEAKQNTPILDQIIVVEGYMDVIVLAQHGITNAVATLGTSVNSQHIRKLFKLVSKVVLCFDGDKAGRSAAIRGLEASLPVMQDEKQVRFLFLPEGEDPDSLVRKEGKEAFNLRLEDASSLSHVLFDHARNQVTLGDEEGEAQFARNAMEMIKQIPKELTFRSVLIRQLSDQSGIDSETLGNTVFKTRRQHSPTIEEHESAPQNNTQNLPHYDGDSPDLSHYEYEPSNGDYDDFHHGDYPPTTQTKTQGSFKKPFGKKSFSKGKFYHEEPALPPAAPSLSRVKQSSLCLLLHPHIAKEIDLPDPLVNQANEELQIFCKIWRYFAKHPNKNTGHLLGETTDKATISSIYALLNHQDATTKQKITNAQQEVLDMVSALEKNLGLNSSIARLKNKGNESIKDSSSKQELRNLMDLIRQKKH
ncbi:DNA primase [Marinomonas rhizomae]|uniref:DNA primase n=1 Tax=Marinomonas rhizomae TaxID=491948 RepID=A0A366J7S1_9GAMM|nr:DNA primase [Marinomonas rhizomae]RBP83073.1 DNA primase [Marinomonas rhizomae]RNF72623.1 DNA primase [Marinomonas rhizomae]